ncbi:MAG: hypothetical protein J4G04_04645 [Nitrosopumilaceae archaeon]|nr:hypothetical protein [Nitrosopumilaceae archaeon]
MSEFDEFAEALFAQLDVELSEEKEIARLAEEAPHSGAFDDIEGVCDRLQPEMAGRAADLLGLRQNPDVRIEYPELNDLKLIKGRKVFCPPESRGFVEDLFGAVAAEDRSGVIGSMRADTAKYLVYSTYAIQYISKITTTYGDYLDGTIFVNRFILSRYPDIILHKMGGGSVGQVKSGYMGAAKMTILEESVHSMQEPLQQANRLAAAEVNAINERLAGIVLDMDEGSVKELSDYLQLQAVPDDFPFARTANLFFFLNPDHFLTGQIGPDVMTYTHVEVDPAIEKHLPDLSDIYMEWLSPIQRHHAAFSVMEGMAGYAVHHILGEDPDFEQYSATFSGSGAGSYQTRKDMGRDFVEHAGGEMGAGAFRTMIESPPTTIELKDPRRYVRRLASV